MVSSILHRATGIALAVGSLLVVWGMGALASGEAAFDSFRACAASPIGLVFLIGWTWALFYHLCNGIRHLLQDAGAGYEIKQFVFSSWLSVVASLVLTALVWAYVFVGGAA
jgi:succinate dehydrogenase / fumarate reductase cytochrome b subunit